MPQVHKHRIWLACALCSTLMALLCLAAGITLAVLTDGPLLRNGARKSQIWDEEEDAASSRNGGETCETHKIDLYLMEMTNWHEVRVAEFGTVTPSFAAVGPYNFTRQRCIFDKRIGERDDVLVTSHLQYYSEWSIESKPAFEDELPVSVDREVNIVNPAYFSVMEGLRRPLGIATGNGAELERNLAGPLSAAVLSKVLTGLLEESATSFRNQTFLGAFPTILSTIQATFIAMATEMLHDEIQGEVQGKNLCVWLWTRSNLLSNFIMTEGVNLDDLEQTTFDGFELGTYVDPVTKQATFVATETTDEVALQLWDASHPASLLQAESVVQWNASREDDALAAEMRGKVAGMTEDDVAYLHTWFAYFLSHTAPTLVTNQFYPNATFTKDKSYRLAWLQVAEGAVTATKGLRPTGLPFTISDFDESVTWPFELSDYARRENLSPLPLINDTHLEYIVSGACVEPPFDSLGGTPSLTNSAEDANNTNVVRLTNPANMIEFLALADAVATQSGEAAAAEATLAARWKLTAAQATGLLGYLRFATDQVLDGTGPVVRTTAAQILYDRVDPLLEVLLAAGTPGLTSARSGLLYNAYEHKTRESAAQGLRIPPSKCYAGEHESIVGSAAQEEEFAAFIERRWWVTDFYDGQLTGRGPTIEGVWRDTVQVSGRSGEIHPAPLAADEALLIWNDGVVRPLRFVPTGATTELEGIEVWEYAMDDAEWQPNELYFQGIPGFFNVSSVRKANLFLSMPRQRGVAPEASKVAHDPPAAQMQHCCDKWRLYVEPKSGITMGKDTSSQLNFESHGFGSLHVDSNLPAGFMPFMWIHSRSVIGAADAETFKSNVSLLNALFAVGVVLATAGVLAFVLPAIACCKVWKQKEAATKSGYNVSGMYEREMAHAGSAKVSRHHSRTALRRGASNGELAASGDGDGGGGARRHGRSRGNSRAMKRRSTLHAHDGGGGGGGGGGVSRSRASSKALAMAAAPPPALAAQPAMAAAATSATPATPLVVEPLDDDGGGDGYGQAPTAAFEAETTQLAKDNDVEW